MAKAVDSLNNESNASDARSLVELLHVHGEQKFTLDSMNVWAKAVGALLPDRTVITLEGDLGAGKTTMARGICEGAGVFDVNGVTSPTFAILQHYPAPRGMIVHADLYRLKGDADLDALGWDEIVDTASLLLVEWPERATRGWPVGTISIAIGRGAEESSRTVRTRFV